MYTLVGQPAPDFSAKAIIHKKVVRDFTLSQFRDKKYVLLLFYPMNFRLVCPTELHAFQDRLSEFEQRDVQVIACSIESEASQVIWQSMPVEQGGIEGVSYPFIADVNKDVIMKYAMLRPESYLLEGGQLIGQGDELAARGHFLIDKQGIIRYQVIHDTVIGRSVDETLRVIDGLIEFQATGNICPANWKKGQKTIPKDKKLLGPYLQERLSHS